MQKTERDFSKAFWKVLFTVLSVLSSISGILIAIFTDHTEIALWCLILALCSAFGIWTWHLKQIRSLCCAYKFEELYKHIRYTFHSRNEMDYEVTRIIRWTSNKSTSFIHMKHGWSGRGNVFDFSSIYQPGLNIELKLDASSGDIEFDYPLNRTIKYGDIIHVQYSFRLSDTSQKNEPVLSQKIRNPNHLLELEVILLDQEKANPAQLLSKKIDDSDFADVHISNLEFNQKTKRYRCRIINPTINFKYMIKWEAN